jgi:hypothetical protein
VKLASHIGCEDNRSKNFPVGDRNKTCAKELFGITEPCYNPDKGGISDAEAAVKHAWIAGGIGVVGGLVAGFGSPSTDTSKIIDTDVVNGRKQNIYGTKFNSGLGVTTMVSGAVAGIGTGLTMGLTATSKEVGQGTQKFGDCFLPNGTMVPENQEIELQW